MKIPVLIAALIIGVGAAFPLELGLRPTAPDFRGNAAAAVRMVESFRDARFESTTAHWDSTLRTRLPAESLAATWGRLVAEVGPVTSIGSPSTVTAESFSVVEVPVRFGSTDWKVRTSYDRTGKVAGLYFIPLSQPFQPGDRP